MVGNKAKTSVVLIVLTIIFAMGLPAGAGEVVWRGKVQTDYLAFWLEGSPFSEQGFGQLNLLMSASVTDGISAEVEADIHQLANNGSTSLVELSRIYLKVNRPHYTLVVGRQALSWGAGTFYNPADPFAGLTDPLAGKLGRAPGFSGIKLDFVAGQLPLSVFHLVDGKGLTGVKYATKSNDVDFIGAITAESDGDNLQTLLQISKGEETGWFAQAMLSHLETAEPSLRWAVGADYRPNEILALSGELANTGANLGLPGLGIYQAVAEDAVSVALSVQYHREKNSRYALALVNVPREESLLLIPSYTAQPAEGLELRVYGLKEFAATEATAFGAGLSYKF